MLADNALSGDPYASHTVKFFSLQTGSAWADSFTGQLDGLSVELSDGSVANVNFEPYGQSSGAITSPEAGMYYNGTVGLAASYDDGGAPGTANVQWAVREGTCAAGTNTVLGNVDGHNNPSTWDGSSFAADFDTTAVTDGSYCFVFNPADAPGQNNVRETRQFYVDNTNPLVQIHRPHDGATISETKKFKGTASDVGSGLRNDEIRLSFRPIVDGHVESPVKTIHVPVNVDDVWKQKVDTTELHNGLYRVVARANDNTGTGYGDSNTAADTVNVTVRNLPESKVDCKDGHWMFYSDMFENQGDCVAYVNHHDDHGNDDNHARGHHEDESKSDKHSEDHHSVSWHVFSWIRHHHFRFF